MVDQVQHFDVCSIVNNRQTGAMTLQVRTHTNSVSDVNMDSEKVDHSDCTPMKNTKKALYQRERRANPVVRSLEQSSENVQ